MSPQVSPKGLAMSSHGHHPCSTSLEGTEDARLRRLWGAVEAWPCVAGPEFTLCEVTDEA